ncbi:MAG: EamA family transporter [Gemmatimonadales bacterium]|jgi:drug/metabolite transporter (DMT)-like permease|nr:EamA family transporter [Gemmatimonadales bacterium]
MSSDRPSRSAIAAAFFAIYVIWGSTYLAIQVALETIPAAVLASSRFLLAGVALLAWAAMRRDPRPSVREVRAAALLGFLFLVLGNGLVVWAEQKVPSGLTSLLVAGTPLFTTLLLWALPPRRVPTGGMLLGVVLGLAGLLLLVLPGSLGGAPVDPLGALALAVASLSWAFGSVLSPRLPQARAAAVASGLQMLLAGMMLGGIGLVAGGPRHVDLGAVSPRSWFALAYLVVFGSLVAFSAFAWLLRVSTPERTATTAYVNPVVAVLLGWLLAGEPLTARTLLAGGIIIAAVAVIVTARGKAR